MTKETYCDPTGIIAGRGITTPYNATPYHRYLSSTLWSLSPQPVSRSWGLVSIQVLDVARAISP